jgi:hypothetical protein
MRKIVKIAVSMPAAAFKELETLRRKTGKTRSQIIRDALAAFNPGPSGRAGIGEERAVYGTLDPQGLIDPAERKRRALAAVGRFHSGLADLSEAHDRYLEEVYAEGGGPKSSGGKD